MVKNILCLLPRDFKCKVRNYSCSNTRCLSSCLVKLLRPLLISAYFKICKFYFNPPSFKRKNNPSFKHKNVYVWKTQFLCPRVQKNKRFQLPVMKVNQICCGLNLPVSTADAAAAVVYYQTETTFFPCLMIFTDAMCRVPSYQSFSVLMNLFGRKC